MKRLALFVGAAALALGLVTPAVAADETLSGSVMCAKCTLKQADAKECQDVLVVKDAKGTKGEYSIAKNAVAEKFGHVCTGETPATVTGAVTEKDGKKWITATKMEKVEKKS
jgi:phosphosulfolactate phosphohydrolase-like enzyme